MSGYHDANDARAIFQEDIQNHAQNHAHAATEKPDENGAMDGEVINLEDLYNENQLEELGEKPKSQLPRHIEQIAQEKKHSDRNTVVYAGIMILSISSGAFYKYGKSLQKAMTDFWHRLVKKTKKKKIAPSTEHNTQNKARANNKRKQSS